MDDLGEAVRLIGVANGLPQLIGSVGESPPGDKAFGDLRPNELMLVMLLAVWLLT